MYHTTFPPTHTHIQTCTLTWKMECTHTHTYTYRAFDLTQLSHRHLDWSLPALTAEFHHDNSRQGPLLPPLLVTTAPSPPPRMEHVSTVGGTCSYWCLSHVCVSAETIVLSRASAHERSQLKCPKLRVGCYTEEMLECFNRRFSIKTQWNAVYLYVTSRLGFPGWFTVSNSPLLYMGTSLTFRQLPLHV